MYIIISTFKLISVLVPDVNVYFFLIIMISQNFFYVVEMAFHNFCSENHSNCLNGSQNRIHAVCYYLFVANTDYILT